MIRTLFRSDSVLALFVIAVTAMLVLSIPPAFLDLLIVVNLALSVLILLVALYVPNPSQLLSFPAILLLSTLFRLSLNVASTRLILLDGYAGDVIQTFGSFLIRGQVVVGIILFAIITVVNFVVVARGSSRVAEVAARFTLDALPVKQMSIESDMKAGILTTKEAVEKREELRRESQLYGSMDGAMKFVQGDVLAGLFIIFTNIVGGLYVGVSRGLTFPDAIQTYTLLTIGDGLVTQIPALMISICAGIVVTRVSSGGEATLGMDVSSQLFRQSGTLFLSGLIIFVIGVLLQTPVVPFTIGAVLFWVLGALSMRSKSQSLKFSSASKREALPIKSDRATAIEYLDQQALNLFLHQDTLFNSFQDQSSQFYSWYELFSDEFNQSTGMHLPPLQVFAEKTTIPGSYRVEFKATEIFSGTVPFDSMLLGLNPNAAKLFGIPVSKIDEHPITGAAVFWTPNSPSVLEIARSCKVEFYSFFEYISFNIAHYFTCYPQELVRISDVFTSVKQLSSQYPGLIQEVIDGGMVTVPQLTAVMQQLAREGVYIGEIRSILESIADYYSTRQSDDVSFILLDVVDAIRKRKKRELVSNLLSSRGTLRTIVLSNDVEEEFLGILHQFDGHEFPQLDKQTVSKLKTSFEDIYQRIRQNGLLPLTIVCQSDLKPAVFEFVRAYFPKVRLVSLQEIDPRVAVEKVAEWRV